jgi:hypothetical protein
VRVDHERAIETQDERVAVGRRSGDGLRADVARGAGLGLDDDLLAESPRERFRDHAAARVRHAARCKRDDEANRPVGIAALRESDKGNQAGREAAQHADLRHSRSPGQSA